MESPRKPATGEEQIKAFVKEYKESGGPFPHCFEALVRDRVMHNVLVVYNMVSECLQIYLLKVDQLTLDRLCCCHGKYGNDSENTLKENEDLRWLDELISRNHEHRIFDDCDKNLMGKGLIVAGVHLIVSGFIS